MLTQDGQIKDVKVYDYNYPSDAERAALSQTGGERIIWISPFRENKLSSDDSQSDKNYYISDEPLPVFDYSRMSDRIVGFIFATSIPTIVLFYVHPFFAILFNILLARWWFTD